MAWKGQPTDGGGSCLENSQGFGPCEFDPRPFRVNDDEPCKHYRAPHPFFPRPVGWGGRRCTECEAEEYAAWQASVKARLDEALLHIAHGLDATWDRLPCAGWPNCVPSEGGRWLPPGWTISASA